MRRLFIGLALAITAATACTGQDSALAALVTGDDARGWEAVGRLDIAGKGFCTGALIAPDLVLTAAHCLFDRTTGDRIAPERIEFQAGLRNGRALAYRGVRRAVVPVDYTFDGTAGNGSVPRDIALLELTQPIRSTRIVPFEVATDLVPAMQVGIVSYGHGRAEAPSLQEICAVLGRQPDGTVVMTCSVDFGSSGAPVFYVDAGVARIASVVSAMAEMDGVPVALGADIAGPLAELRADLVGRTGGFQAVAPPRVRVVGINERAVDGARFVRP